MEALIDIPPDRDVENVVQAETTENLADEFLHFSSLTVVSEVETSDPTECEFVDIDTECGSSSTFDHISCTFRFFNVKPRPNSFNNIKLRPPILLQPLRLGIEGARN